MEIGINKLVFISILCVCFNFNFIRINKFNRRVKKSISIKY